MILAQEIPDHPVCEGYWIRFSPEMGSGLQAVEGEPVSLYAARSLDLFLHAIDDDFWAVSEGMTGAQVWRALDRETAIKGAKALLRERGVSVFRERIRVLLEEWGPTPRYGGKETS